MFVIGSLCVACNVSADAVDVEIDDGGLAALGEEEGAVAVRIHKEVLDQDACGQSVAQDIEFRFKVRVAVGVVGYETLAGQMESGCIVQAGGQFVHRSLISIYTSLHEFHEFFGCLKFHMPRIFPYHTDTVLTQVQMVKMHFLARISVHYGHVFGIGPSVFIEVTV